MSTNPELVKKSNAAEQAYGRFKKAMRRYGLTEKAMQEAGFDTEKMNPVCAAMYTSWQEAEAELAKEVADPSQPPLDMGGGTPPPATGGRGRGRKPEGEE